MSSKAVRNIIIAASGETKVERQRVDARATQLRAAEMNVRAACARAEFDCIASLPQAVAMDYLDAHPDAAARHASALYFERCESNDLVDHLEEFTAALDAGRLRRSLSAILGYEPHPAAYYATTQPKENHHG